MTNNNEDNSSSVRLRSIYVSTNDDTEAQQKENNGDDWAWLNSNGHNDNKQPQAADIGMAVGDTDSNDDDIKEEEEDLDESDPEPLTLPESTHTLFFTQPIFSISGVFASSIVFISFACLIMALTNNLQSNSSAGNPLGIPPNVGMAVRVAQYLSIFIAMIMEEEIPTGLYLLRTIKEPAFKKRFPNKRYIKFIASAILRIVLGYAFLVNVFVILAQATGVLDIFYDVLALQFISELDDIAFSLAKIEVLGRRLQRACTARLFQTEWEKQKMGRNKRASVFLKSVYFVNLAAFLGGMIFVSTRQNSGYFQCSSITVDFGDAVWEDPIIVIPGLPDPVTTFTLVFSYFNGVYVQDGTHEGRPLYKEMRKFDSKPMDQDIEWLVTVPAEIKYSGDSGGWIFTHPYIRKEATGDETWLLRSPETDVYDLLNVQGEWSIWLGRIDTTSVSISCNRCREDADCNLNGKCEDDGTCTCKTAEETGGTNYIGTHCEVKLKESTCGTIKSEEGNVTYSIQRYSESPGAPATTLFEQYNRPVYTHIENFPNATEGDIFWLLYTGRRWFGLTFNIITLNATETEVLQGTQNFHGFWSNTYNEGTIYVSDATIGDSPVGVDFFLIGERGDQFGPYGALYPLQKDGQEGRGLFRCTGPPTIRNDTFGQGIEDFQ